MGGVGGGWGTADYHVTLAAIEGCPLPHSNMKHWRLCRAGSKAQERGEGSRSDGRGQDGQDPEAGGREREEFVANVTGLSRARGGCVVGLASHHVLNAQR